MKPLQDRSIKMNSQERDRFELLSAYFDGEVTATERKKVQKWLDSDPQTKQLYSRLLRIRHGLKSMPLPAEEVSTQEVTRNVWRKINQRRLHNALIWGSGGIAALFVGTISGIVPGEFLPGIRVANSPEPQRDLETLEIAVNEPAIEIPKAPVSSSEETLNSSREEDKVIIE
ncbi:MAG: hypothetical protein WBG70_06405 [Spirulinaceae cyanobacterium]